MSTTVSSGVTSSGLTVSSGGSVVVENGGVLVSTRVLSDGLVTLDSGATGSSLTISAGGDLAGPGMVYGTITVDGAVSGVSLGWYTTTLDLTSGATATSVSVEAEEDLLVVRAGATASGSEVGNYNADVVYGTVIDTDLDNAGYETVHSGGVAIHTDIQIWSQSTQVVESGGVASDSIVSGTEEVEAGGRSVDATVYAHGVLEADDGAIQSGTTVRSGGALDLTKLTLSSGVEAAIGRVAAATSISGALVESGGVLNVADVIVQSGATLDLGAGGGVSALRVSAGGLASGGGTISGSSMIGGALVGAVISGYDDIDEPPITVEAASGGETSLVTVLNGDLQIDAGATATSVTLDSGPDYSEDRAYAEIYGSAVSLVVDAYDNAEVFSGGVVQGSIVQDSGEVLIDAGGVAQGAKVESGGLLSIASGARTSADAVRSGGTLMLFAGGVLSGETIASGAFLELDGVNVARGATALAIVESASLRLSGATLASGAALTYGDARVYSGGVLSVGAGAYVSDVDVLAGATLVGVGRVSGSSTVAGVISRVEIATDQYGDYGMVTLDSGGVAIAVTVDVGADLVVEAGASASSLKTLGSGYFGGDVVVSGVAIDDQINGGEEDVYGRATSSVIASQGIQFVEGGEADDTLIGPGDAFVDSGGVMDDATVLSGGFLGVNSGASIDAILSSGGRENIEDGGADSGATVLKGALLRVSAGGSFSGVIVSSGGIAEALADGSGAGGVAETGGKFLVVSGGVEVGATISSGGDLIVRSGGVATSATVLTGGAATVSSGGVASSLSLLAGGVLVDDGTANYFGDSTLAGRLSGGGTVYQRGDGVLVQSGDALAFSGTVSLSGGTIELANAGGFGAAEIKFDATSSTLELLSAAQPRNGGTFREKLFNFDKTSEDLDLAGQAFVSGATATLSGHTLKLVDGAYSAKFVLSGTSASSYASSYIVTSDGLGGTLIEAESASGAVAAGGRIVALAHAMATFDAARHAGVTVLSSGATAGAVLEMLKPR